jgi:FAD synthase
VNVEFVHKIRDQHRFGGIDELSAQLQRDVDRARALIAPILSHG